jgi:hypothetical protein
MAQSGSASALGAEGRRFESYYSDQEQLRVAIVVPRSHKPRRKEERYLRPLPITMRSSVWSEHPAWNREARRDLGGSNPPA